MDGKKAIQILKWHRPVGAINAGFPVEPNEDMEAFNLAIKALEKQIPMKVLKEWDYAKGDITRYRYHCSSCESLIAYNKFNSKEKYCKYCGQKLDWTDKE